MIRYLPLTCVLLALASGLNAAGNDVVYKWVDDTGETHYTQTPPRDREYETLKQAAKQTSAPAREATRMRTNLQEQVDAMDKRQEEKQAEARDAEQWARIQKVRRENCEIAKKNLANLGLGGNRIFMTPDGEVVRLTDEERQRRVDEANMQIEENCD